MAEQSAMRENPTYANISGLVDNLNESLRKQREDVARAREISGAIVKKHKAREIQVESLIADANEEFAQLNEQRDVAFAPTSRDAAFAPTSSYYPSATRPAKDKGSGVFIGGTIFLLAALVYLYFFLARV